MLTQALRLQLRRSVDLTVVAGSLNWCLTVDALCRNSLVDKAPYHDKVSYRVGPVIAKRSICREVFWDITTLKVFKNLSETACNLITSENALHDWRILENISLIRPLRSSFWQRCLTGFWIIFGFFKEPVMSIQMFY